MRLIAVVWGLLWGSFANVVIHRVPAGESVVRPRSRCPQCDTPISGYDNIPVLSYLMLRGKCRHCQHPIPVRYPIVELMSGVLCFALYMRLVYVPLIAGEGANIVGWLLAYAVAMALLVITYIDLDHWIIPDVIVLPMAGAGVLVALLIPDALGVSGVGALGAAIAGYGLFAGIRALYLWWRGIEALGLGDAKLLLMVGATMGPLGLIWTIGAGAIQGLIISVPMVLMGRNVANQPLRDAHGDDPVLHESDDQVMGRHVPFGPFLALAGLEFLLLRPMIDTWMAWLAV